jgi:hypothetical protein
LSSSFRLDPRKMRLLVLHYFSTAILFKKKLIFWAYHLFASSNGDIAKSSQSDDFLADYKNHHFVYC